LFHKDEHGGCGGVMRHALAREQQYLPRLPCLGGHLNSKSGSAGY
jgi:hypothetical protein